MSTALTVVVIGAGPVGLAAAAHLLVRGFTPLVLETANVVGAGILRWSHVRMFSPWEFNLDREAVALLKAQGWQAPIPHISRPDARSWSSTSNRSPRCRRLRRICGWARAWSLSPSSAATA
jgi:phytoene dehydrogenase-like protein